jgi:ribosomal protein L16 Arg81 hydroxylase
MRSKRGVHSVALRPVESALHNAWAPSEVPGIREVPSNGANNTDLLIDTFRIFHHRPRDGQRGGSGSACAMTYDVALRLSAIGISELLAPVASDHFWRERYERAPLVVAREAPPWLSALPGERELDGLVAASGVAGHLRMVKEGAEHARAPSVGEQVLAAYADGWTLVLGKLQSRSAEVGALAASLEEELAHRIGVNLYATPPGAQGFREHADGHDVFVLQTHGSKTWRVFRPVIELPLESQVVRPAPFHEQILPAPESGYGDPLLEVELRPGHVLYLPRGFVHSASTSESASVHLTFGLHAPRRIDIAEEALKILSAQSVELRRTVGRATRSRDVEQTLELLRELFSSPDLAAQTEAALQRREALAPASLSQRGFASINHRGQLDLETRLRRRPGARAFAFEEGGKACLHVAGNRMDGPLGLREAFDYLAAHVEFRVGDLPDPLSDKTKLVLARRLLAESMYFLDEA